MLRAAREANGLSLHDVAQVTRFSARQIEALEKDDYASLPGSTAVRGFVRGYAKFLKLDPAPLLAALPPPSAPVIGTDVRPPGHVDELRSRRAGKLPRGLRLLSWSLLLLAVIWYIARPDLADIREYFSTFSSTHGGSMPTASSVATTAPAAVSQVTPSVAASESAPVDTATASPSAPSLPGSLHLEFDGLSWIEIRDATRQVVFSGEYPAGTRQEVAGQPPFQVWIGKASNVRVFFGDRLIDLQPYTRAEVARLTVE
jgi:cytoskeleton protein RodZ